MGSLLAAPKVPHYATKFDPAGPTPNLPSNQPQEDTNTVDAVTDSTEQVEESAKTEAEKNLLTRPNRGRSSTILTSFRGLLESNAQTPFRKSLLGE